MRRRSNPLPLLLLALAGLDLPGAALAQPAAPGYPDPRAAGFHQCALIYDRPQRSAADLLPYVARTRQGRAREWLFDAFLFLVQESGAGVRTEYGQTRRPDWEYQLDRWFAPGRDLAALDAAISSAARSLGAPPPRRIILSIPYPNPAVHAFGDVDGDGREEDLATAEGRRAVLRWYVTEARRRFASAHYRHLELWGFYWMREDMDAGDEARITDAAAIVHVQGVRLLWIPWFRAPGWDRWKEAGFDVALMQPNYAFWSSTHNGRVRRNRLAVCAELARRAGLGVEMEAGDVTSHDADRRAFYHYLADGAPGRLGYQRGAQAYYLGVDLVERMAAARDPKNRALYDALADYVAGRAVRDPDARTTWRWHAGARGDPSVRIGEARFGRAERVDDVEVYLDEPGSVWRGIVRVEVRATDRSAWSGAGWAIRASRSDSDGRHQVVVAPVRREACALRITLTSQSKGMRVPTVTADINTAGEGRRLNHLALGKPYRVTPGWPAAYGDDGAKLTDGIVPAAGFPSGQTVGWYGVEAAVSFDLGRSVPVDRLEVCCSGGSAAAVNWPRDAVALLSATEPLPSATSGTGAMPTGLRWIAPGPVLIDRVRSATEMDGRLVFTVSPAASARYVTFLLDADGWLMLSEVRIFSRGRNVAPSGRYTLDPQPTPRQTGAPTYPDDGRKLTDGRVAEGFSPVQVAGWSDDAPRQIEIDLGQASTVREVTVWCLTGGLYAIHAPASVTAEASLDGSNWVMLGVAHPAEAAGAPTCRADPLRIRAARPVRARLLRVKVRHSEGWAMLSEVEVR